MALHVMEEANRCLGCKVPQCQKGCPIATPIPEVIKLLKAGELDAAGRMLFENNPKIGALLYPMYSGGVAGDMLCKLIAGDLYPSGHLQDTLPESISDYPSTAEFHKEKYYVNYTEDIFVGYRYFETFAPEKAAYPFGFGLSYTDFVYENAAYADGKVTVTVKNAGKMDAEEVVQVYVKNDSKDAPLHPALCGFKRVAVKAGESVQVEITLSALTFTVVNDEGKRLPCEKATLFVGGYQPDAVSAELTGKKCLEIKL